MISAVLASSPPLIAISSEVTRFPVHPNVQSSTDEASSQMGDEGCPNESQSVEDATGYSIEEGS